MSLQLNTVQVPTKWFSVYQQMSLCNIPRVARFLASLWEKHENSIDACNETALVANNVLRRLGKAYRQIAPFYICEEHMQNVNLPLATRNICFRNSPLLLGHDHHRVDTSSKTIPAKSDSRVFV
ncbi:hypothetical protein AcW1_002006 [Taiwanofungus camphoratus]|nr:hypothetical protein AcW1_002006 [Antrodia cinnamomea]